MARMARVVVPGVPHHVTQRGNRKQRVFFDDGDYQHYIDLLARYSRRAEVQVLAYCLMPNHVHIVMVPQATDGLHRSLAETHRRYTCYINFRENWKGYLWQGRFSSFPMDDAHLYRAVRYIELNPVRANLCRAPEMWKWSSACAHFEGMDDELVTVGPMLKRVTDWGRYLSENDPEELAEVFRHHERTGRPLGTDAFVGKLENISGRSLRPQKRGPKSKR